MSATAKLLPSHVPFRSSSYPCRQLHVNDPLVLLHSEFCGQTLVTSESMHSSISK